MPAYVPFIDRTYFQAELEIGQVDSDTVNQELMIYIRKYEFEFLSKLMGRSLFEAWFNGMKETTPADEWKRIAYGDSFLLDQSKVVTATGVDELGRVYRIPRFDFKDGMNVTYRGLLKNVEVDNPFDASYAGFGASSPIAKYIYFFWNRFHQSNSGGTGETVPQVHNGTIISNNQKMIWAWNEMCREVFEFYLMLDQYKEEYPEFDLPAAERFCPKQINEFNFL